MNGAELVKAEIVLPTDLAAAVSDAVAVRGLLGVTIQAGIGQAALDPAAVAVWNDRLIMLKETARTLEAAREGMKAPHLAAGRRVDGFFKPLIDTATKVAGEVGSYLLTIRREQERIVDAERARIQKENEAREREALEAVRRDREAADAKAKAEAEAAGFTPAEVKDWTAAAVADVPAVIIQQEVIPAPVPNAVRSSVGSSVLTRRWTFEITEAADIPIDFLTVDEGKIRKAIAAGIRTIPGVRIYQAESLTTRSA